MEEGVLKIDYSSPLTQYRGLKLSNLIRYLTGHRISPSTCADVFYMFYLPYPVLRSNIKNEYLRKRAEIIKYFLTLKNTNIIRVKSILNPEISTLATLSLAEKIINYVSSYFKHEFQKLSDEVGSDPLLALSRIVEERKVKGWLNEFERLFQGVNSDIHYYKVIKGVVEQGFSTKHFKDYVTSRYIVEALKLAKNINVRRILDLTSRIVEKSKLLIPVIKSEHFRGELDGITLGNDVERIIPSEIVLPETFFFLKYIENSLLIYRKIVKKQRNPIYILVDKSSSMEGRKTEWARAVTLALIRRALLENRKVFFRFFTDLPCDLIIIDPKENIAGKTRKIGYILTAASFGETDIDYALSKALEDIEKGTCKGCSAIIIITDGQDMFEPGILMNKLRKTGVKLFSVMIKGDNDSLRMLSQHYFKVVELSEANALKIVKQV